MKNLILFSIFVLSVQTYAFNNNSSDSFSFNKNKEMCDTQKLEYCLENSDSDGCFELSGCELPVEEAVGKICLQLYMPVTCGNQEGMHEVFSNECEAYRGGYDVGCKFFERLEVN
jgi:hypothetical protein